MTTANPDLDWRDNGTPVSIRFDDPYFSIHDGLAETCHVFLDGNRLSSRLVDGFHVAELGFGTGLNLLALARLADDLNVEINFTTFEAYPLSPSDMARAHENWPELSDLAATLRAAYPLQGGSFSVGKVHVDLRLGIAQEELPVWQGKADAWFLDGFSPARNPELWSETLMAEVGRHTTAGGTFATYTSAGHVRRSLTAAGFDVQKQPGFGRKREMSTGILS